jgi:hypothetical protein
MASRKLKEIDAARSLSLISLDWSKENEMTSYKGRPSKPGKKMCLDQLITDFTSLVSRINRCIFNI